MAYAKFNQCPRAYARNSDFFGKLLDSADNKPLRFLVLDDSQGTQGTSYITHLMAMFYRRYGNMHETPFSGGSNSFPLKAGHFNPEADAATFGRVPTFYNLPDMSIKTYKQGSLAGDLSGGGYLCSLDHIAGSCPDSRLSWGRYFHPEDDIRCRIWASTYPGSGGVQWNYRPTGGTENLTGSNLAWSTITQSGSVFNSGELADGSSYLLKSSMTPTLTRAAGTFFHQIQLYSTSATNAVDLWGVQWVNMSRRYGISILTMSAGGYTPALFLSNHRNAALSFAAAGPFDAVIINTGVNNMIVYNITDPQSFYDQLYGQGVYDPTSNPTGSLIDTIRSWSGNPSLPFFLCPDQYSWNGAFHPTNPNAPMTTDEQDVFDRLAGVEYAIARQDDYIAFCNTRLVGDQIGWNSSGVSTWTNSDFIHPNADGGWMHANIVYQLITSFSRNSGSSAAVTFV